MQPILDRLRAAGLSIRRLTPVRQTLEDLFMQAVIDPASGQAELPAPDCDEITGGANSPANASPKDGALMRQTIRADRGRVSRTQLPEAILDHAGSFPPWWSSRSSGA